MTNTKTLLGFNGNLLQATIIEKLFAQFDIKLVDSYDGQKGYIFDVTGKVAEKLEDKFAILSILSHPEGDMPAYILQYPHQDFMNPNQECLYCATNEMFSDVIRAKIFADVALTLQEQTGLDINAVLYNPLDEDEQNFIDHVEQFLHHEEKCRHSVSNGLNALKSEHLFVANKTTGEFIVNVYTSVLEHVDCGNFTFGNGVSVYTIPPTYGEDDIIKDALFLIVGLAESLLATQPNEESATKLNEIIDSAQDYYFGDQKKNDASDIEKLNDMIGYIQGMIATV